MLTFNDLLIYYIKKLKHKTCKLKILDISYNTVIFLNMFFK